jgi:hypothetical protein
LAIFGSLLAKRLPTIMQVLPDMKLALAGVDISPSLVQK